MMLRAERLIVEPLARGHSRARYPLRLVLAVAMCGAGWAPASSSRFDERPPAPTSIASMPPLSGGTTGELRLQPVQPLSTATRTVIESPVDRSAPMPVPRPQSAGAAATRKDTARRQQPHEAAQAGWPGQIARMKAMLKLTPAQEQYWPAVEAVLRDIARQQIAGTGPAAAGKPARITLGDADTHRLMSAAFPLLMTMSEDQKRDAMQLARAMGVENVASAF
jgi:hypothetical protein